MRNDVLYNFISPITGRLPLQEGYTFVGDKDGFSSQSSIFIDTRQDLIDLRRDLDKTSVLTKGYIWMGNGADHKEEVSSIGLSNLPTLGSAIFPIPLLSVEIPIPNPTFDPFSPLAYIMSSPWLPQVFAGSMDLLNTTSETVISSSFALNQINTAQALKRIDNAGFIVKNRTINYSWENPIYDLVTDPYLIAAMELYGLGTTYTFNEAQALDELGAGIVSNDVDGNLVLTSLTNNKLWIGQTVGAVDNVPTEIEQLPIGNIPNLTHNNVWVGDINNRPVETLFSLAPDNATYILQTPDASLPNSQALSEAVHEFTVFGGLLKTGSNGVVYLAKGGTEVDVTGTFSVDDYVRPIDLYDFKQQYHSDFEPYSDLPQVPIPGVGNIGQYIVYTAILTANTNANLNLKQTRVNIGDDPGDLTNPERYSQLISDYPNTILGGDNIGGYVTPQSSANQFVPALLKKNFRILEDFSPDGRTDEYINYQYMHFKNDDTKPSIFALTSSTPAPNPLSIGILSETVVPSLIQPSGIYHTYKGFFFESEFGFEGDDRQPKNLSCNMLTYRDNAIYAHDPDQIETIFKYDRNKDAFIFEKNAIAPFGTTAQRPITPNLGMFRVNTDNPIPVLEISDGTNWYQPGGGGGTGTVTSVGLSTNSSGLNISNSPITTSGIINIDLSTQLSQIANNDSVGILTATGLFGNTIQTRVLEAGDGISITYPDGNLGNPTLGVEGITLTGAVLGSGINGTPINTNLNSDVVLQSATQLMHYDFTNAFGSRTSTFNINNLYGSAVFGSGAVGSVNLSLSAYGDGISTDYEYAGYTFKSLFDCGTEGAPKTKSLSLIYKDLTYSDKLVFEHDVTTNSLKMTSQLAIPIGTSLERPITPVASSIRINTDTSDPTFEYYANSQWYQSGSGTVTEITAGDGLTANGFIGGSITSTGTLALSTIPGLVPGNYIYPSRIFVTPNGRILEIVSGSAPVLSVQGYVNQIDVTGTSTNPILTLSQNLSLTNVSFVNSGVFNGTGLLELNIPYGSTATRLPPNIGAVRVNTTTGDFEYSSQQNVWSSLSSSGSGGVLNGAVLGNISNNRLNAVQDLSSIGSTAINWTWPNIGVPLQIFSFYHQMPTSTNSFSEGAVSTSSGISVATSYTPGNATVISPSTYKVVFDIGANKFYPFQISSSAYGVFLAKFTCPVSFSTQLMDTDILTWDWTSRTQSRLQIALKPDSGVVQQYVHRVTISDASTNSGSFVVSQRPRTTGSDALAARYDISYANSIGAANYNRSIFALSSVVNSNFDTWTAALSAKLSMVNNIISDVADPINQQDAVNLRTLQAAIVPGNSKKQIKAYVSTSYTNNMGVNDHIKFNTLEYNNGGTNIILSTASYVTTGGVASLGRVLLTKGRVYNLTAYLRLNSANAVLTLRWHRFNVGSSIGTSIGNTIISNGITDKIANYYLDLTLASVNVYVEVRIISDSSFGSGTIETTGNGVNYIIVETVD
jgi:hypothetical protein